MIRHASFPMSLKIFVNKSDFKYISALGNWIMSFFVMLYSGVFTLTVWKTYIFTDTVNKNNIFWP